MKQCFPQQVHIPTNFQNIILLEFLSIRSRKIKQMLIGIVTGQNRMQSTRGLKDTQIFPTGFNYIFDIASFPCNTLYEQNRYLHTGLQPKKNFYRKELLGVQKYFIVKNSLTNNFPNASDQARGWKVRLSYLLPNIRLIQD